MKKIVLVGAGGHALNVLDSLRPNPDFEIIGMTDPRYAAGEMMSGCKILGDDCVLRSVFEGGVKYAFVSAGSIGCTSLREKLYHQLKSTGFIIPSVIDHSSNIGSGVMIGEGTYVGKNAVISAGSTVEIMVIINTGAVAEHGCYIGSFVHIGPGAVVCGDVKIGAGTHVGANAAVIQGVTIGEGSIIGAGSTVVHDVPGGVIAYGNPCKVVRSRA